MIGKIKTQLPGNLESLLFSPVFLAKIWAYCSLPLSPTKSWWASQFLTIMSSEKRSFQQCLHHNPSKGMIQGWLLYLTGIGKQVNRTGFKSLQLSCTIIIFFLSLDLRSRVTLLGWYLSGYFIITGLCKYM